MVAMNITVRVMMDFTCWMIITAACEIQTFTKSYLVALKKQNCNQRDLVSQRMVNHRSETDRHRRGANAK